MPQDEEHLRLLSMFQYICGGIAGVVACFPLIHVLVGIAVLFSPPPQNDKGFPAALFGGIFIVVGALAVTIGWTVAGCMLATGRFLAQRRRYTFCLVIACIECLFMPMGTVLGVFTILVLMRESVKKLFEANALAASAANPADF